MPTIVLKSFKGHKGRPGQHGGSLPKNAHPHIKFLDNYNDIPMGLEGSNIAFITANDNIVDTEGTTHNGYMVKASEHIDEFKTVFGFEPINTITGYWSSAMADEILKHGAIRLGWAKRRSELDIQVYSLDMKAVERVRRLIENGVLPHVKTYVFDSTIDPNTHNTRGDAYSFTATYDELMMGRRIVTDPNGGDTVLKSFTGHKGIPGVQGGSLPRNTVINGIAIPTEHIKDGTNGVDTGHSAYFITPDNRVIDLYAGGINYSHQEYAQHIKELNPTKMTRTDVLALTEFESYGFIRIYTQTFTQHIELHRKLDTPTLRKLQHLVDSGLIQYREWIAIEDTSTPGDMKVGYIYGLMKDFMSAKYITNGKFKELPVGVLKSFTGHKGRIGHQGGSLPRSSAGIETAPEGLKDLDKRRSEAINRIAEWQKDGMTLDKIVRDGYQWRDWSHRQGDAWSWAMWEQIQGVAKRIGYEYKNPLTEQDIFDDPTLDTVLLRMMNDDYDRAFNHADVLITDRRNNNTSGALIKFLASDEGKKFHDMNLRELWGSVVANKGDIINVGKKGFSAARHFETIQPFPGMQELAQAKTFKEALSKTVTVYRGIADSYNDSVARMMTSYTTSPEIAKLFAEGYYYSTNNPGTGKVVSKTVKFGDIMAYINMDGEYEVLLPARVIKLKSFTGHKGIPGQHGGSLPRNAGVAGTRPTGGKAATFDYVDIMLLSHWETDPIEDVMNFMKAVGAKTEGNLLENEFLSGHEWDIESEASIKIAHTTDVRGKVKDKLVNDISNASGIDYKTVNNAIGSWAATANDNTYRALSLQQAIAEEFGMELSPWQKDNMVKATKEYEEINARARGDIETSYYQMLDLPGVSPSNQMFEAGLVLTNTAEDPLFVATDEQMSSLIKAFNAMNGPIPGQFSDKQKELIDATVDQELKLVNKSQFGRGAVADRPTERKIVRTMYENTQKRLAELGHKAGETVRLYRGVVIPNVDYDKSDTLKRLNGNIARYKGNVAESWSVSPKGAFNFAKDYAGRGYMLAMDVPIESILSLATTGFGCLTEGEVVVIGNLDNTVQIIM